MFILPLSVSMKIEGLESLYLNSFLLIFLNIFAKLNTIFYKKGVEIIERASIFQNYKERDLSEDLLITILLFLQVLNKFYCFGSEIQTLLSISGLLFLIKIKEFGILFTELY